MNDVVWVAGYAMMGSTIAITVLSVLGCGWLYYLDDKAGDERQH